MQDQGSPISLLPYTGYMDDRAGPNIWCFQKRAKGPKYFSEKGDNRAESGIKSLLQKGFLTQNRAQKGYSAPAWDDPEKSCCKEMNLICVIIGTTMNKFTCLGFKTFTSPSLIDINDSTHIYEHTITIACSFSTMQFESRLGKNTSPDWVILFVLKIYAALELFFFQIGQGHYYYLISMITISCIFPIY